MKPVARKYRFEEVPSELEHWARLPIEERLRAVVEMARFWVRVQGIPYDERIAPVARKRTLEQGGGKSDDRTSGGASP